MKKIISVLICMLILLSVIPFTVSAANEAKFVLRIKEETDKNVILTIDFEGGTGFSALDFEVKYDRVRLQAKGYKKGDGYVAFENKLNDPVSPIYSCNVNENPIMFAIANISPFKATDGKKSIAQLAFTKVPGTKFEKNDVSVDFTNCQTSEFENIKVTFDYDLTPPASTSPDKSNTDEENSTEYAQQPSSDNIDAQGNEIGEAVTGENESTQENNISDNNDKDGKVDAKTVIVIVVAVLIVAGAGIIIVIKSKKKKQ